MNKKPSQKKAESSKKRLNYLLIILLFLILVLGFQLIFIDRIYPGVFILGVNVSGLNKQAANLKIADKLSHRLDTQLKFSYSRQSYKFNLAKEDIKVDLENSINQAMVFGRRKLYFSPQYLEPKILFNESFDEKLTQLAEAIDRTPVDSQIKLVDDQINVTASQNGLILDKETLKKRIAEYVINGQKPQQELPTIITYPKLGYDGALEIKHDLDQVKLEPITLIFEEKTWTIDLEKVLDLIALSANSAQIGSLNPPKLKKFLDDIALEVNREVKEPLFQFEGGRVVEFRAPVEGKRLQMAEASTLITSAVTSQTTKIIELPVETIQPQNKLTNDLGIKELIGTGISNFAGSIPNRIFNIGLAASRINGILVKPGEIFSFNNTVGDISASSGYKQAYVIKSGRTVLDDGGGVCQVSTTLFRTVLNSGLPVIERVAHAYRVGYYEQGFPPGLDATIFHPSVDFKFKNDTSAHVLIQAYVQGNSLYIEFYGTSDGRVAKLSKSTITDQTPPPPELRQDDPTLPKGEIKQVDWAAWGANVSFSRTVTRNGETIINETFKSNFRPWQAVYLVGTGG